MYISNEILNNELRRTATICTYEFGILVTMSLLVSYENTSASKIQYNLTTASGSMHIEYRNQAISYYTRGQFNLEFTCTLSASIIPKTGSAYTSIIVSKSAAECFSDYLRLSEQRGARFEIGTTHITKIEKLPPTQHACKSIYLSHKEICVYQVAPDN